MAKVLVSESNLTNIANAIRAKNGSSDTYTPAQMATAIQGISTGMPEYTVTYPTNLSHQRFSLSNLYASPNQSESGGQGKISLNPNYYIGIQLQPDSGYDVGNIIVDGRNTGSSSFSGMVSNNMVLSATEATEHIATYSGTMTVGRQGSAEYNYVFGYSKLYATGGISPVSFEYNNRTYTIIQMTYARSGYMYTVAVQTPKTSDFTSPTLTSLVVMDMNGVIKEIVGNPQTSTSESGENYNIYFGLSSGNSYFATCYGNGQPCLVELNFN